MKLGPRIVLGCLLACVVLRGESVCVKVLDRANLPLPNAQVVAQNLTKSKVVPLDAKQSIPEKAFYCYLARANEFVRITVSVEGFISSTLENIKILAQSNRKFTIILEFQEGEFDVYKN